MTGSFVFCLLGGGGGGGLWHLDPWTIEEEIAAIEDKRIEVCVFFPNWSICGFYGTNLITAASNAY